jgi:hypothetical protein
MRENPSRAFRGRMQSCLVLLSLGLSLSSLANAQRIDALKPQVRKYVSVDTPRAMLEHVQIIDGTGAAPKSDQNITIEGGKITGGSRFYTG